MKWWGSFLIAIVIFELAAAPVCRASETSFNSDVRTVLIAGAYGAVGGTAIGLISWPFTHDGKSVLIGTSVGLYLGIVVGIFHVWHRDDPNNPLRSSPLDDAPRATELVMNDYWRAKQPPPVVQMEVPVFRF